MDKKRILQTVHTAEVDMAFGAVAHAWENPNLSVDEMCEHLDAIGDVITGDSTFADFTEATGITNNVVLN